nr:pentatricopeptide repeat-containing protein At5g24830 [Ipomoea batatas]
MDALSRLKSEFNFCLMNLQMLVASESHFLLRILNGSFQVLDSIRYQIDMLFADYLCSNPSSKLINTRKDGIMRSAICCELRTEDWPSERNELPPNQGEETGAVFNVLDSMLKDMLDRLKTMREKKSWTCIGFDSISKSKLRNDEHIIRALCKEGKLGPALSLWSKMIHKFVSPDVFTYNYLINGLSKAGDLEKAEWLVKEMLYRGPTPSCATYNTLIKGYCRNNNVDRALDIFSTMSNHGITPDRVSCNILVDALCKKGLIEDAKKLLEAIIGDKHDEEKPNLITSTIIMDGYFKNGASVQALALWEKLRSVQIDGIAYNVIIHGFCLSQDTVMVYNCMCKMLKTGITPDVFSYNTFIGLLCKEGKMDEACYMFNVMTRMGVCPDRITYKMIIQGLCMNGEVGKANDFLCCMLENSIIPEPLIWNVVIHGYGRHGSVRSAEYIRSKMVAFCVPPNVYTYNALIYAKINDGNFIEAHSLKKEMLLHGLLPDLVTFNLLIGAACSVGNIHSALHLYGEMLRMGCEPDIITFTELLKCCCILGKMKEAEWLFGVIRRSGLRVDHVPFLVLMKRYWGMREIDKAFDLRNKKDECPKTMDAAQVGGPSVYGREFPYLLIFPMTLRANFALLELRRLRRIIPSSLSFIEFEVGNIAMVTGVLHSVGHLYNWESSDASGLPSVGQRYQIANLAAQSVANA